MARDPLGPLTEPRKSEKIRALVLGRDLISVGIETYPLVLRKVRMNVGFVRKAGEKRLLFG